MAKGEKVSWNWGGATAEGKVVEAYDHEVERTIRGTTVKRKGSKDNRALLIEQDGGAKVLKLESELKGS